MRTGPCAFDPAASLQPRGPSASCLFNNPNNLSSYSPIALCRLWIQSKSTPGWLFDIKASPTEIVREEKKGGKKQQFGTVLCRITSSSVTAHWLCVFVSSDVLQKFHLLTVKIHERFWGFKCQLIGFADCGHGIHSLQMESLTWHFLCFVHRMEVCWLTTPQPWLSMSVSVCGPTRPWSVWSHLVRAALKLLAITTPRTRASKPNSPMSLAAPQTLRVSHRHCKILKVLYAV